LLIGPLLEVRKQQLPAVGSTTANTASGRRKAMSRDDLERALIADATALQFSDHVLGETFNIGSYVVRKARKSLEGRGLVPVVTLRRCIDGFERDTSRIGRPARRQKETQ
jgi:hypothetical protein